MLFNKLSVLIFIGAIGMSAIVQADDTLDALEQATALYKEGKAQEALAQLEVAAQFLRQQRAESLEKVLPEPLSGWKADDAESASVGAAMFGGGSTISRRYTKDNKSITINLVTDSPMLQSMMGLIMNPAFGGAANGGGKLQMINGQKAMVKSDGIMMVVDNKFLINIDGSKNLAEDMLAYAKAIDFKKLSEFK